MALPPLAWIAEEDLVYDEASLEVTGVLDWEFARRGDPVDDLLQQTGH